MAGKIDNVPEQRHEEEQMKNLMRIAALFVAVVLAAGFVSCGNDDD